MSGRFPLRFVHAPPPFVETKTCAPRNVEHVAHIVAPAPPGTTMSLM
jgi:hypothetical protein